MTRRKSVSPDEAVARLAVEDRLVIPLGPGQPKTFLHALGRRSDWERLEVFGALLVDLFPVFAQKGVSLRSGFFGPAERALRAAGHSVFFVPADFRRFERIAEQFAPRVIATAGAPPDEKGRISLSLHAGATVAAIAEVGRDPDRLLVVETSPAYPRTLGVEPDHRHSVSLDEVDLWIESDAMPPELPDVSPGPIERAIARFIAPFIPDGATLQTGIGGIPNAVVELLAEGGGGDYGIHSEMFTNGLMRLHRAGKVSNQKGVLDGFSAVTFAMGSRALYDWLDGNEDVRFLPVSIVNAPEMIARNRSMVSINGALSIDLFGQVMADSIVGTQHSGIGGHEDFMAGAGLGKGARSILCLPSSVEIAGRRRSRIVPTLDSGSLVTSPRHQVDVVVSEHGVAELAGRTVEERARALAAIAHPEFRADLLEAVEKMDARGGGE